MTGTACGAHLGHILKNQPFTSAWGPTSHVASGGDREDACAPISAPWPCTAMHSHAWSYQALLLQEATARPGIPLETGYCSQSLLAGPPEFPSSDAPCSRLRLTVQLKCKTTAGHLPRGLGFLSIQLPTSQPESRVPGGGWQKAWAGRQRRVVGTRFLLTPCVVQHILSHMCVDFCLPSV